MTWRNTRLIFLREARDQLRDRRTLFMVAVLPVLLYPAMGIGLVQMTVLFREQPRTVVVLGAADLPGPPLFEDGRFGPEWFYSPGESTKLRVVSDAGTPPDGDADPTDAALLAAARRVRAAQAEVERLSAELAALDGTDPRAGTLRAEREAAEARRATQFAEAGLRVLILVPDTLDERMDELARRLRTRGDPGGDSAPAEPADAGPVPRPLVLHNNADEKSQVAYRRVRDVMDRWEDAVLRDRLLAADLPEDLPRPVAPVGVDLAVASERAASLWAKLLPALLVVMTISGAFYPAVDVGAGEKERGTMETLLICPASRGEIVAGKFLTVLTFAIATAALNLLAAGLTGGYVASIAAGSMGGGAAGGLAVPSAASLAWVAVLIVPLAALVSALCLAIATFAKSNKEGQYYLYPLLMVGMGLTFFCMSPAVELTPLYAVVPIVNVTLLLKQLLAAGGAGEGLVYVPVVLGTSFAYAALALWWAVDLFKREEVLFREAERFDLAAWLKHLFREKEDTPTFAEAAFCFVLILLLTFATLGPMRAALTAAEPGTEGVAALRLLILQQLVTIALPAVAMALMLTRRPRRSLRLTAPDAKVLLAAAVLPFALQPLATTLSGWLTGWFFPPLPEGFGTFMAALGTADLWLVLLAVAVAPAVCEELAFRGFLLSGFERSGRQGTAVVLSALAFGIVHVIPQQVFNAALVGLVIGLLAVRGGSLLPCCLFHLLFNGQQVVLSRADGALPDWLAVDAGDGAGQEYRVAVLVACGVVAAVLLRWLWRYDPGTRAGERADGETVADAFPADSMTRGAGSAPVGRG